MATYNFHKIVLSRSAAFAFQVLESPDSNILGSFSNVDYVRARKTILECVLSTDMVNCKYNKIVIVQHIN